MDWANLLVPLDGSPLSEAALPYAEAIAEATGASLRLLSVIEREPRLSVSHIDLPLAEVERYALEAEETRRQARAQYLASQAGALQARGHVVSYTVVLGEPVDAIRTAASSADVTLIAMASRGHDVVGRVLVGSVADAVMRLGVRPTLLVRSVYFRVPPRSVRLQQIMVALDGSPGAEAALPLAGDLAGASGATLLLVRVERSGAAAGAQPGLTAPEENTTVTARAYLARARDQLPQGLNVETIVLQGSPAQSLAEFVAQERIDLVVMSTRGRGGLHRILLGSTAEALVRSNVPTLLVRAPVAVDETEDTLPPPPTVTVREIMSQPVVTAREDATLEEIARLMLEHGVGGLPLVDAQGELSGIITESDFTGKQRYLGLAAGRVPYLFGQWVSKDEFEATYQAGRTITAKEIMSAPVITAAADQLVVDVVQQMVRREMGHFPVVSDGLLVGMVTRHDLLKLMVRDPS
jgi:nucleotide-binding universal stress UspA family protein/predicted transcriptional regulator